MADWPEGLIPIPIHNSDVQSFKGCRDRWNWLSDLRESRKPIETPTPLSFGSAMHAAFEVYYTPLTWHLVQAGGVQREAVLMRSIDAFRQAMRANRERYLKLTKSEALNEEQHEDYLEHYDLGIGMLMHYFEWVQKHDTDAGLVPVDVEVPFEFPVFDSYEQQLEALPDTAGHIVVYRGRIDLLVRDKDERLWILDHKTTARMPDNMVFLEMDEQMGSYILGYTLASGEQIAGAIYSEILKGYPKPPAENKVVRLGRRFSVNQNQHTSYEVYKATLEEAGEDLELYEEMLHWLKNFGTTYVRRTIIPRNTSELRNIAQRIQFETLDMLDNPRIYPSPGRWSCDHCPVRPACLAKMEGQDYQWILEQTTTIEKRTNA